MTAISLQNAADSAATNAALPADAAPVPSIRSIILAGLKAGSSTEVIAAAVKLAHPTSAAAAKSAKHIAYYRCLVKQGRAKLPADPASTEA